MSVELFRVPPPGERFGRHPNDQSCFRVRQVGFIKEAFENFSLSSLYPSEEQLGIAVKVAELDEQTQSETGRINPPRPTTEFL